MFLSKWPAWFLFLTFTLIGTALIIFSLLWHVGFNF
jgi:hypothetical protein